ncbi:MAG: PilN domain-containing protein [Aquabacterium sp.]
MLFRRRKSHDGSRWVSVIQEGSVMYAAQLAYVDPARPRVDWLWQGEAPQILQGLSALKNARKLRNEKLIGLLDRAQYRMQASEAPSDVPRDHWADAIRWQLKDQVDFPVDDAVIDVLEVPHSTQLRQNNAVMAFLIPRTDYTAIELAADDLGMGWAALDVPETSLRNICALTEDGEKAQALVVFGEAHGMLVITYKGELLMARHIEVAMSAITGEEEVRGAALSRAALEILRTVDTFERMHSQVQLSGMTVALPPGCGPEVLELLAELIYVPLSALQLSDWFDLSPLGDEGERVGRNVTFTELCLLGSGLRASQAASTRAQLSLLDPESVLGQSPQWGALLGVRLIGAVAVLGLGAGLGLRAAATAYTMKAEGVEAELNSLRAAEAANPPSPVVQELEGLRQKEAQQRQMQDTLTGSMAWSSQGYSEYLMALGRRTHPLVWLTQFQVVGDGHEISMAGRTLNPQVVPQYLQKLAQEERFKGRRFAQITMTGLPPGEGVPGGIVQFSLRTTSDVSTKTSQGEKSVEDAAREIASRPKEGSK